MTGILLRQPNNDGILRLTLNDPGRRNALSEAMLGELAAAFADASTLRLNPGPNRKPAAV